MQKFSGRQLAETITASRRNKKLTQQQLATLTGINRALISRIESQDFMPSIEQLEKLAAALDFDIRTLFPESGTPKKNPG